MWVGRRPAHLISLRAFALWRVYSERLIGCELGNHCASAGARLRRTVTHRIATIAEGLYPRNDIVNINHCCYHILTYALI